MYVERDLQKDLSKYQYMSRETYTKRPIQIKRRPTKETYRLSSQIQNSKETNKKRLMYVKRHLPKET